MNIAIIGLSNSGKTTVFNALTGLNIETHPYPSLSGEPHKGVVKVPDMRLNKLSEIFKPKKTTNATIEYIDFIGLTKGEIDQNKKVFDVIKDADALLQVVRVFKDDKVFHPFGNIDALRDIETVDFELIFGDLELIEKRLNKIDYDIKRGKKPDESEKKLLLKCKNFLEKEIPLSEIQFSKEEKMTMKHLQFLSLKSEIIVLNISEDYLNTDKIKKLEEHIKKYLENKNRKKVSILSICGKLEMELSQLLPEEAQLFFNDLGIKEPALNKLVRMSYYILDLISFFTYTGNELRAWSIRKGATAQESAGKIHSDIERGFIRAEVISYEDFIKVGNIHAARDKGLLRLEGKTYEVKDGDIIYFRFNI
ncbi:MAG: redox-regulated ATPase YchF [Nitrospirae bacterium]|nr:redox-regulated ATPase YchF [Nitrospirota bacterium]